MKTVLLTAAMTLASSVAMAVTAGQMTCDEAKAYYAQHGRITADSGVPVYGDNRACTGGEKSEPVFVRTSDTSMCAVAHRCVIGDRGGPGGR